MLLDKFNDIEIKNENRIDEADKLFCETNQQAYDYARENLKDLIVLTTEQIEDQNKILQPINQRLTYFSAVSDSLDKLKRALHGIHQSFIGNIVEYFANKYKVTLLPEAIKNVLLPKEPDRWRSDADTGAWEEYENALENLSLKYSDILERIFIQLDGFSFFDKAVKELKDKAHSAAWSQYHGKLYEQKKAVITFPDGCWCSPYFSGRTHIELGNGMKNVIKIYSRESKKPKMF